jgi:hypothetical protein
MCARLNVLVSSRHNGPAFIAANTSSVAETAVPIRAATVSTPGFDIRFNDTHLEIERRNCRPSMNSTRASHVRIIYTRRAVSQHCRQPGGMISVEALDSH